MNSSQRAVPGGQPFVREDLSASLRPGPTEAGVEAGRELAGWGLGETPRQPVGTRHLLQPR